MTLGTGIFLSSLFLGLIWLYGATAQRWNWARILRRSGVALVLLITVAGGALWGSIYYDGLPKKQTEYWGVPLGATEGDVLFLKGEPDEKSDGSWQYGYHLIGFRDGRVRLIIEQAGENNYLSLQGVGRYSSREDIIEKFGPPSHESESADHFSRLLSYEKFNLVFSLRENAVEGLGVYASEQGPLRFKNEEGKGNH